MCASGPKSFFRTDKRTGTTYGINMFSTRALPIFTKYHSLFYNIYGGRKKVPQNIASLITPVAFAFWIADDGNFRFGLYLNTQGFTRKESLLLLRNSINNNFDLNSYLVLDSRNLHMIYVPAAYMPKVRSLVLPHLHTSVHYKLGL